MKAPVITVLFATLLCAPAFSKSVEGPEASALYNALKDNGAQSHAAGEMRKYAVSDVRCSSAFTANGLLGSCDMQDDIAGKVLRISDRGTARGERTVVTLIKAMRAAGAKVVDRAGGSSIDASSIECASVYFRGVHVSCELKN
ncbi:MAG: hypothetical protein ACXWQO_02160 [Bdellovibrionota bacterium]